MLTLFRWVFIAAMHQIEISTVPATSENNKKVRYTKKKFKNVNISMIMNAKN